MKDTDTTDALGRRHVIKLDGNGWINGWIRVKVEMDGNGCIIG